MELVKADKEVYELQKEVDNLFILVFDEGNDV